MKVLGCAGLSVHVHVCLPDISVRNDICIITITVTIIRHSLFFLLFDVNHETVQYK